MSIYALCIQRCLAHLDEQDQDVPTRTLKPFFLNNLPKTRALLSQLEQQGMVVRREVGYNYSLWSITELGRKSLYYNSKKKL